MVDICTVLWKIRILIPIWDWKDKTPKRLFGFMLLQCDLASLLKKMNLGALGKYLSLSLLSPFLACFVEEKKFNSHGIILLIKVKWIFLSFMTYRYHKGYESDRKSFWPFSFFKKNSSRTVWASVLGVF